MKQVALSELSADAGAVDTHRRAFCKEITFVTVIIPVHGDTQRLPICLNALRSQTFPQNRLEILVVDNEGRQSSRYSPIVARFPGVRLLLESRPGSYAARNAAIAAARGDIFAFTDADCIPDPNWLKCAVDALESSEEIAAVGGRIDLFHSGAQPSIVEWYDELFFNFRQSERIANEQFAETANMVTKRTTIQMVGPFNDLLRSAGDRDWGRRVHAAGLPFAYCESAVVRHPSRNRLGSIVRKLRRMTGGLTQISPPSSFRQTLNKAIGEVKYSKEMRSLVRTNPHITSALQNRGLQVLLTALQWVRALEIVRLYLGGSPQRF